MQSVVILWIMMLYTYGMFNDPYELLFWNICLLTASLYVKLRVVLLMMLVVCLNGTFTLEQPMSSFFEFYPRWRDLVCMLQRFGGENAVTCPLFVETWHYKHACVQLYWNDPDRMHVYNCCMFHSAKLQVSKRLIAVQLIYSPGFMNGMVIKTKGNNRVHGIRLDGFLMDLLKLLAFGKNMFRYSSCD